MKLIKLFENDQELSISDIREKYHNNLILHNLCQDEYAWVITDVPRINYQQLAQLREVSFGKELAEQVYKLLLAQPLYWLLSDGGWKNSDMLTIKLTTWKQFVEYTKAQFENDDDFED